MSTHPNSRSFKNAHGFIHIQEVWWMPTDTKFTKFHECPRTRIQEVLLMPKYPNSRSFANGLRSKFAFYECHTSEFTSFMNVHGSKLMTRFTNDRGIFRNNVFRVASFPFLFLQIIRTKSNVHFLNTVKIKKRNILPGSSHKNLRWGGGGGSATTLILNIGTWRRPEVNFMLRTLCPPRKSPGTNSRLGGPQRRSGRFREYKNLSSVLEFKPRTSSSGFLFIINWEITLDTTLITHLFAT
jgi:hypothetical protein